VQACDASYVFICGPSCGFFTRYITRYNLASKLPKKQVINGAVHQVVDLPKKRVGSEAGNGVSTEVGSSHALGVSVTGCSRNHQSFEKKSLKFGESLRKNRKNSFAIL
jgi:hypothetical protein